MSLGIYLDRHSLDGLCIEKDNGGLNWLVFVVVEEEMGRMPGGLLDAVSITENAN